MRNILTKILVLAVFLLIMFASLVAFSAWECEKCPRRDVALFDLDVRVPQPGPEDSLSIADWLRLFLVTGGVHDKLFNEDPSKSCISFYDGQLGDTDYLVTGTVTESVAGYVVHVTLEAGVTRELVAAGSASVDLKNISASGKQAAEGLTPLMENIREFQKKKRDENKIYAIYPKMEVIPKKKRIETEESTKVTIKLNDCDDFALKDRKVKLSSTLGRFEPQEVIIDERGEAEATFIAGNKAGCAKLTADWEWKYPCGHGPFLCSEGAIVSIDRPTYATITIRKTYDKTLNSSHAEDTFDGSCKTHWEDEHTLNESIEAVVTLSLKLEYVQDMLIYNQSCEYYKPVSVSLSTFNYNSNEHKFNAIDFSGAECARGGHRTNIDYFRNVETYEIEDKQYVTQTYWMVVFDNETGKAVKIIPSCYDIAYEIHEQEKLHTISCDDQGCEEDTKTTNKKISKSFELAPVGEWIADPTIKKSDTLTKDYLKYVKRLGYDLPPGVEIPTISYEETIEVFPDLLVKSGDGKTNFGGYGNRTIRADIEHGYTEEKLHYTWQMTRRKK